MDAYEIQKVALDALEAVAVPRVLRSSIHSHSAQPDDPAFTGRGVDSFKASFVATRAEFRQFVELCNQGGVWINFKWTVTLSTKFIYDVTAVERTR